MAKKLKNAYHFLLAWFGAFVYGFPSRKIYVIGVTGTKGKSSTVELVHAVLQAAGKKTALLSSVHIGFGSELALNPRKNTMPGRMFIQKFLRQAVDVGCEYAIFEVTSQGVVQHRHRFIDFDVAAVTCLHPEHIESHGTYEKYRGAKVSFFRDTARLSRKKKKLFFINSEMSGGGDAQFFEDAVRHPTGVGHFGAIEYYNKQDFIANALGGSVAKLSPWFTSDFNLENAALAYAICRSAGVSSDAILEVFKNFPGVFGRYEWISAHTKNGNFSVVVDYAHTPGSFEALFKAISQKKHARILSVFGSYGHGRDVWKRPETGAIAEHYSDHLYITDESSGDEDPMQIINQIASGVKDASKVTKILDRREAIQAACSAAREGDIVALVGKGHESDITTGGRVIAWNERAVAEELLAEMAEV